jgi:phthiocerol/phenolphthiocerol synthesis type-I polyketide synthase E
MTDNGGEGLSFSEDHGLVWEYISETESDFIFDEIFVRRVYVQNGVTVTDGSTIVDVGANIGLFSLFFAHEAKHLKILCVEPLPPIFCVLRRNLAGLMRQNHDVHFLQIAIGNDAEENLKSDFYFFPG